MHTLSALIYFGIGFFVWYISYGLEKYFSGGSFGRGNWWVFKCFWEELWWYLPGGLGRRTDYIREITRSRSDTSFIDNYSYKTICTQNLYEQVAKESLGSGYYFWGVSVFLFFFLWPLLLCTLAILVILKRLRG